MKVPENIYHKTCINPACKKQFTCRHDNRRYCSERCKRNFERDLKRKEREKILDDQKEMQKNVKILGSLFNSGKTNVSLEELRKKGFNANHFINRVQSLKGEIIYAFEGYFLHKINDKEFVITKI